MSPEHKQRSFLVESPLRSTHVVSPPQLVHWDMPSLPFSVRMSDHSTCLAAQQRSPQWTAVQAWGTFLQEAKMNFVQRPGV